MAHKEFWDYVLELMGERGINQNQLARGAGISRSTLAKLRRGEMDPGVGVLRGLAKVLGVDWEKLIQVMYWDMYTGDRRPSTIDYDWGLEDVSDRASRDAGLSVYESRSQDSDTGRETMRPSRDAESRAYTAELQLDLLRMAREEADEDRRDLVRVDSMPSGGLWIPYEDGTFERAWQLSNRGLRAWRGFKLVNMDDPADPSYLKPDEGEIPVGVVTNFSDWLAPPYEYFVEHAIYEPRVPPGGLANVRMRFEIPQGNGRFVSRWLLVDQKGQPMFSDCGGVACVCSRWDGEELLVEKMTTLDAVRNESLGPGGHISIWWV